MFIQNHIFALVAATISLCSPISLAFTLDASSHWSIRSHTSLRMAGGWGNNQERSISNEEFGGVNGSPIYDSYEIEDRGQFMQRVNAERKTLRN
eukprot:CCRYP_021002-RA/>CCRYP_021002-RA protein AED:0.12 eAED:0.12 QI:146/-1/1/1/-1/0/1/0/93